jgi:hypothetical protein
VLIRRLADAALRAALDATPEPQTITLIEDMREHKSET